MRRPKPRRLIYPAIFAFVLALTAPDAGANVLMNGDFEGPPPNPRGNGWFVVPAPYPAGADLPLVGAFAAGGNPPNNMLSVGNDFATPPLVFGADPVGVYSDFDCLAPDEGVGSCAVDFDYIHLNVVGADPRLPAGFAPDEQPMVTLVNANGVASYRLPALGVLNARRLRATIPDCLPQTRVYFWLRSNQGDPPGTADSMLIDNVTCACDPGAKPSKDLEPDSMPLPFDPDAPPKPLPDGKPYPVPPGPDPDFTDASGETPARELEEPLRIATTIILALVVLGGLWLLVRMWSKGRKRE